MGTGGSDDDDLEQLLEAYLAPPVDLNPEMAGIRIEWVEGDERLGALHMWVKHGVTCSEVEQVLLEIPPMVESKRSKDFPERTLFWGATRGDRWLFVVCEDWQEGEVRILKPLTAFEPQEGEAYWRRQ